MKDTQKPPAVILGLSPTGLAVARSLGRQGIYTIGIDRNGWAIGKYSKYISEPIIVPEQEWEKSLLEQLENISTRFSDKPVLFCAEDKYIEFLGNFAEKMSSRYIMPSSLNKKMIDLFLDKEKFYRMCTENGIEIPNTFFPKNLDDVISISTKIDYPCIIKPSFSHVWRRKLKGKKMIDVNSPQALIETYRQLSSWDNNLIIQEVIPGGDERIYVCGVCFGDGDTPLAVFTGRKLRQFPPYFGSASLAESLTQPDIAELSSNLLKNIHFQGICGTEFKKDPRDERFKMMEINLRPVLWFSLVEKSGVDVIYATYQYLAGLPVPAFTQKDGVRWIYSARDLLTSFHYLRRSELSPGQYVASLKNIRAHAIFAADDPKTALFSPLHLIKEFFHYYLGGDL